MTRRSYQLTPYPVGSVREFWALSWPLMLAMASSTLMIFVDRLFLARYDYLALNGSTTGGAAYWLFLVLPMGIAAISEVLVGRFHGEGKYEEAGPAAWQMVIFSLLQLPLSLLIAYTVAPLLFVGSDNIQMESLYFTTLMQFAWVQCLNVAFSGFFVGIGDVKKVTVAALIGNAMNIVLDFFFIFGIGPIPEMGIEGAALATGLSMGFQTLFLLIPYFSKENRLKFNTASLLFRARYFIEGIRIGVPAGAARVMEVLGHFLFLRFVAASGQDQMTILSMVQSLYILISFISDAECKAASSIIANLLGAEVREPITAVFKAGVGLHTLFSLILLGFFICFPGFFLNLFACQESICIASEELIRSLQICLLFMGLFFMTDGFSWILTGFLTASGDTRFIFWVSLFINWIAYLLPSWWFLVVLKQGAMTAWMIIFFMGMVTFAIYLTRFLSGRWLQSYKKIIDS